MILIRNRIISGTIGSFKGCLLSKPKFTKFRIVSLGITIPSIILYNTNDTVHDIFKHSYLTMKRVGVVAGATLHCFYLYKRTLSVDYESSIQYQEALKKCHKECAKITLQALETNGGIYIKLGQHVGAMTYMLPPEWTETMIPLQDKCPQSALTEIDKMFKEDLKLGLNDLFSEFDATPIGVASLAQVHIATLKSNNEKVAVKCQHPSLKEFVPLDVMLTQTVFKLLDIVFHDYPLTWLGDELQDSIYVELDFRKEAQNALDTSKYFSNYLNETALRIPKIIASNKRILILEYVSGERLDNLKYLDDNNISRAEVSFCLSHIFNNMIFTPNVGIHCDPHGGNLAIRHSNKPYAGHNFEIILYDHGLYRHPTTRMRRDYAKFWLALLDHDIPKMQLYAKKFANIDEKHFPLFAAAITGRSIDMALNYDISKRRSDDEVRIMATNITEGSLLVDLMSILSHIPRIILLILKTNDLTRHLDECLQNPLGPERTFLILSQYCAKTVYGEAREMVDLKFPRWSWKWLFYGIKIWIEYQRRKNQLVVYDIALWLKMHSKY